MKSSLSFARQLRGFSTQLELVLTSAASIDTEAKASASGAVMPSALSFFRVYQSLRGMGVLDEDELFFRIVNLADTWADRIFASNEKLHALEANLEAIKLRDGVDWDIALAGAPEDFKALDDAWEHRYTELTAIREQRLLSFLLDHGETELADLYLTDRTAFDRRREVGRLLVLANGPEDPGSTQVAQQ